MLAKAGYSVTAVGNGEAALRELATSKFDIVLCDLDLGVGPSGLEVLRGMPSSNAATPFVILTGHGTVSRCREAFLHGAIDFVEKPSSPNAVLAVLDRICGEKERGEQLLESSALPALPESRGAKHVKRAVEIVSRRSGDPAFSVKGLAAEAGVSAEHLARLFNARTGRSPLDHIHEVRIQAAEKLLSMMNLSIYEIAFECGYRTTSELDEWFRRLRQMTPTQFRMGLRTQRDH